MEQKTITRGTSGISLKVSSQLLPFSKPRSYSKWLCRLMISWPASQILQTASTQRKLMKNQKQTQLRLPTQLEIKGQWWSKSSTQTSQARQCTERFGLMIMHEKQNFSRVTKAFCPFSPSTTRQFLNCRLHFKECSSSGCLGISPGSAVAALNKKVLVRVHTTIPKMIGKYCPSFKAQSQ